MATHIPIKRAVNNILKVYKQAAPEDVEHGKVWYDSAHQFCLEIGSRYNCSVDKVAGIVSALSPGCTWEQNKRDAINAIHSLVHGTPMKVSTYGQFVEKVFRIWDGEDVALVLNGPKITAFYYNILRPDLCEHVCIDRHAFKIARGIRKGGATALTAKQMRDTQAAYMQAASELGLRPNQLQAITWVTYKKIVGR